MIKYCKKWLLKDQDTDRIIILNWIISEWDEMM